MSLESSTPKFIEGINRGTGFQNHGGFFPRIDRLKFNSRLKRAMSDEEIIYQGKKDQFVEENKASIGYISDETPNFIEGILTYLNIPQNNTKKFSGVNLSCFSSDKQINKSVLESDENLKRNLLPLNKIYETLYKMNEYLRINGLDHDIHPNYEKILAFRNSGIDQIKAGKFLSCLLNLDKMYFVGGGNILYCYDGKFFLSNSKQIDFANILTV